MCMGHILSSKSNNLVILTGTELSIDKQVGNANIEMLTAVAAQICNSINYCVRIVHKITSYINSVAYG